MSENLSFHIITLGCKINQYETQQLRESWLAQGARESDTPDLARRVLINSCAVTAEALSDLRAMVRRLHRNNPRAVIIITGCAAETFHQELSALPGVAKVVPQSRKSDLALFPGLVGRASVPTPAEWALGPFGPPIKDYARSRPVVKIQDGCSWRCTYCIVPLARSRVMSRDFTSVLTEIEGLFEAGFGEVVLSGISLSQFGRDLEPARDFWDILTFLNSRLTERWAGQARLRISSLDPAQLTDKGLAALSASRLVCPHLHLSLQSASPDVLARMGRQRCRPNEIRRFVKSLSGIWPIFGLGADILVGFPGETARDFAQTEEFYQELPFSYAHVFPYSKRPGTVAAEMDQQVPPADKKSRAKIMRDLALDKKRGFLSVLSKLEQVELVMSKNDPVNGMTEYYAKARLREPLEQAAAMIKAVPTGVRGETLLVRAGLPREGQDRPGLSDQNIAEPAPATSPGERFA